MLSPLFLLLCASYLLHLLLLLLFLTAMCYALHRAALMLHVLVGSIVIVWLFHPFFRRSPHGSSMGCPARRSSLPRSAASSLDARPACILSRLFCQLCQKMAPPLSRG